MNKCDWSDIEVSRDFNLTMQDVTRECMQIQVAMHDAYLVLLVARARQFRTCRASRLGHDCMQTGSQGRCKSCNEPARQSIGQTVCCLNRTHDLHPYLMCESSLQSSIRLNAMLSVKVTC